ncbi:shikimate 5-dehydrogenase [Legionella hackeliae]|uniref:shikimate dehydrogenase (NADP(+)) n=2 Tax=Legionella hackeliae TaxID=449 RepID=A0A0A8UZ24_LEGHA|nr:shikimate 5-dehydrogenase [Legionella hackeliae]CEK12009.1 Shikimate dehydrogenase [Legionella hackeliae]STX48792.1 shikimate 5-dehydrogenase [Legionella hackeliae]
MLIDEDSFEKQVSDFFARGGKGLNITLPFKERSFAMAEVKTARCLQAKAANTLWMQNGLLHADNTDGIGLIRDLTRYMDLTNKQILILGAGGAARGILGPLLDSGISELTLANRTVEKALALQNEFQAIDCCSLMELKGQFDLIINATSASLEKETIQLPLGLLKSTTYCYDLAYNAKEPTAFVKWASAHHCKSSDGLGMLVEQAAESFFIWHGIRVNTNVVLAQLRSS